MANRQGGSSKGPDEGENEFADRYPGGIPVHGGGDMLQWEKPGQEVVGTFVRIKPYKNGHIANVLTEDGPVAFSVPALLVDALSSFENGARIAIVYKGDRPAKKKGQNGLKVFEVYRLPNN